MHLNQEQISFFKTNGYLLVPKAMDAHLCAQVRDAMWASLPGDSRLQRNDPASHVGPFDAAEVRQDSVHVRAGYRWLNRQLGVSETVVQLIYSTAICAMAAQLIGGELRQALIDGTPMGSQGPAWPGGPTDPAQGTEGARGVYCTLPYGDQPRIPYYDHLPSTKGIVHTPEYLAEIATLTRDTPAVECWGQTGDIVFWHHRTAHMAGHNYSSVIRQAVLADFWNTDLDVNRGADAQGDMWRDWSPEVRNAGGQYSQAFARAQRLVN